MIHLHNAGHTYLVVTLIFKTSEVKFMYGRIQFKIRRPLTKH